MTREKADRVREMFAGIAHRYDFLNHFLSLGTDLYWRKKTVKKILKLINDGDVIALDLCCGTGDLSLELARHCYVVGCDFCHPMLKIGMEKIRNGKKENQISLVEGDALELPFEDNSFSALTVAFGVRNFADLNRGLCECHRVLKKGGVLGVLEFSHPVTPVFREIFLFYFHGILPWIGKVISGSRGAYRYLPESVEAFPDAERLKQFMEEAGFSKVGYDRYTFGVAAFHHGIKI